MEMILMMVVVVVGVMELMGAGVHFVRVDNVAGC